MTGEKQLGHGYYRGDGISCPRKGNRASKATHSLCMYAIHFIGT